MKQDDFLVKAGAFAVFGIFVYFLYRKAATSGAFDPTSQENLAYKATNAVGAAITNNPVFNAGADLWEWFNPGLTRQESQAIYGDNPPEKEINPL